MTANLIFLAGSARKTSLNKKLAKAAQAMAKDLGANTTYIDLADYEMPIYNGDYEEKNGLPESTKALKKIFIEHDGFLIASPEYNSSFSPVLKNTLDWISRPESDEEPRLAAFTGKTAALVAASPGALGGLRGLVPLRMMLSSINVHVTRTHLALNHAAKAFDENNNLTDENQKNMLEAVVKEFVHTAKALKK